MNLIIWLLHWATAGLVVAILLTSLPFEALQWFQVAGLAWTRTHIVLGTAILGITIARLVWRVVHPSAQRVASRRRRRWHIGRSLHWWLLILLLALSITGLLAFQQSPLAPPVKILGIKVVLPFKLEHGMHMVFVSLHRWIAFAFPVFLALHVARAFKPEASSGRMLIWRMLWPWLAHR